LLILVACPFLYLCIHFDVILAFGKRKETLVSLLNFCQRLLVTTAPHPPFLWTLDQTWKSWFLSQSIGKEAQPTHTVTIATENIPRVLFCYFGFYISFHVRKVPQFSTLSSLFSVFTFPNSVQTAELANFWSLLLILTGEETINVIINECFLENSNSGRENWLYWICTVFLRSNSLWVCSLQVDVQVTNRFASWHIPRCMYPQYSHSTLVASQFEVSRWLHLKSLE